MTKKRHVTLIEDVNLTRRHLYAPTTEERRTLALDRAIQIHQGNFGALQPQTLHDITESASKLEHFLATGEAVPAPVVEETQVTA